MLAIWEAGVSLRGNKWQNHLLVTGLEAPFTLSMDNFRIGYCKDPAGYWCTFDLASVDVEKIKRLFICPASWSVLLLYGLSAC